jgi:HAD superfamily hydrolase (TIGR01509 family)
MIISDETTKHSIFLSNPKVEIEAILFDMDGVLVDSIPLHIKAWNMVLGEIKLPDLDRKTYLSMLGRTNLDMITKYSDLHKISMPLTVKRDVVDKKEETYRDIIKDNLTTIPGVIDWLDFFKKKKIRCSVASSGEMANIVVVLEILQISAYFTSIISGAHLPASKPDPLIFTLAAASLGVKPERCIVIEDAPAGIQAAKSANMLCCALATSFPSDELKKADLILENFAEAHPETLFSHQLF